MQYRGPDQLEDDVVATRGGDAAERDSDTSSTLSGRDTPLPPSATLNSRERDASAPGLHPSTPNLSLIHSRDTSATETSLDPAAELSTTRLIETPSPSPARNRDSSGSSDSRTGLMDDRESHERDEERSEDSDGGRHGDERANVAAGLDDARVAGDSVDRRVSIRSRRSIPAEDAPPYFEVTPAGHVGQTEPSRPSVSISIEDTTTSSSPPGLTPVQTPEPGAGSSTEEQTQPGSDAAVDPATRRRSGFLNRLHLNVLRQSSSPGASTSSHSHSASEGSSLPYALGRSRHRASRSNVSTPSLFRTISGQRSTISLTSTNRPQHQRAGSSLSITPPTHADLTSPSMISVNSISAPLPHTLMRTEIRYPRGGPTPEQIKLISSRESLGRFGVPYGAEAIAHAAATSRLALDELPPPVFENPTGEEPSQPRPSTSSNVDSDISHVDDDVLRPDREDTVRSAPGSVRDSSVTEPSALVPEGTRDDDVVVVALDGSTTTRESLRNRASEALGTPLHVARTPSVVSHRSKPDRLLRPDSPASSTFSFATAAESPDSPLFFSGENESISGRSQRT